MQAEEPQGELSVCEICGRYSTEEEDSLFCGKNHHATLRTFLPKSFEEPFVQTKKSHLLTIEPSPTNLDFKSLLIGNLLTRVPLAIEESLIHSFKSELQSLEQERIDMTLRPFILRPMTITASTMSKLDNFHETLTRKHVELSFPEINGEIIHRYFGECFPIEKVETNLVIKDQTLTIHCRADGNWTYHPPPTIAPLESADDKKYFVIELKTVRRLESITSSKLESWLLQIACYQLAYPNKTLLLMILDIGHVPYKSLVYEIKQENILRAIRSAWTHWFRNHQKELKECASYQKGLKSLSEIVTPPPRGIPKAGQQQGGTKGVTLIAVTNAFSSLLEDDSEDEEEGEIKKLKEGEVIESVGIENILLSAEVAGGKGTDETLLREAAVPDMGEEGGDFFQEVTKKKKKDQKPKNQSSGQKKTHRR
jgi:hypothetical protein